MVVITELDDLTLIAQLAKKPRHTFASRLVMEGVNLKAVQEPMGHKTIAMTARYTHPAPDYLENELETLVERCKRAETAEENQVGTDPVLVPGASKRSQSSSHAVENKR